MLNVKYLNGFWVCNNLGIREKRAGSLIVLWNSPASHENMEWGWLYFLVQKVKLWELPINKNCICQYCLFCIDRYKLTEVSVKMSKIETTTKWINSLTNWTFCFLLSNSMFRCLYFDCKSLAGLSKYDTTHKNTQQYYTPKCLIK